MKSMLYLLTSWNFFCIQLSQNNEVNVVFTNVVKFLLFIIILFITSLKATSVLVPYLWRNFCIRYDQKFENWKINCVRIEFNNQFQRRIYEGEVLRVYLIWIFEKEHLIELNFKSHRILIYRVLEWTSLKVAARNIWILL